jgi:hypothetical protein
VQSILSLENIILGQDAYVVGGGKSLDFYPDGFFDGRFVLAVNQASRLVPADYIVRKEFSGQSDVPVIASECVAGIANGSPNKADYIFEHNHNTLSEIDENGLHPHGEKIIVSWSTITSAIHLAAYMGARTIFLVGHDCATVNGEQVADGYYDGVQRFTAEQDYSEWLALIAPQTALVRDYIQDEYNVSTISLSPFIGLSHEGHKIA